MNSEAQSSTRAELGAVAKEAKSALNQLCTLGSKIKSEHQ